MSKFPDHSYVKTETYYEGKLVTKKYFDLNTEIFKNYPSKKQILNIKNKVKRTREREVYYTIIISEFGVSIKNSKKTKN